MVNTLSMKSRALYIIVALHIFIIAISNYLVQIPVEVLSLKTTWGAFSFPFIFLLTDLTVRVYGKIPARKIIFMAMIPALFVSYFFSVVFFEGKFVGYSGLTEFNLFVFRIVLASFSAYVVGQLVDITVFNRLRQLATWWIAPLCSTIFGNLIDTICFFSIAFFRSSDEFMATHWVEIASVDYAVKIIVSLFVFLPIYGVIIGKITRAILEKNNNVNSYKDMHRVKGNLS